MRSVVVRVLFLGLTAVGLYYVWPEIVSTFSAWPSLAQIEPAWFGAMVGSELLSFVGVWGVLAIALRSHRFFAIATSHLASNAASRIVPGGAATGGALQYDMLTTSGFDAIQVASGLTASSLLITSILFALPILVLPALLGGPLPQGLATAAWIGLGAFVLMVAAVAALMVSPRPLMAVGRWIDAARNRLRRRRDRGETHELPERLRTERLVILRTMGAQWWQALLFAGAKWAFDYLALVAALAAVGAFPRPSLVLLAFVGSAVLGMIPITPGGLGFVEAGLTGMLVLAGVSTADATIATLAYRLVSYWLPLVAGLVATVLFRWRYRHRPRSARAIPDVIPPEGAG